jgi:hypothetical protein
MTPTALIAVLDRGFREAHPNLFGVPITIEHADLQNSNPIKQISL